MRTMLRAAIHDIEAIRAGLPADRRGHSDVVLEHLSAALRELGGMEPVVVQLDVERRARRASVAPTGKLA